MENTNRHRHTLWIALSAVFVGYFFVVLFCIALFWPVKTIVINGYSPAHPIPVKTTSLYPGQTLLFDLSYCKYSDRTSTVKRELIDGQIITLQDVSGQLPLGCNTTEIHSVVIPETLVPGKYRLSVSIDYPINPIHDAFFGQQRTRYTTEYFTVKAKVQPATAVIYGVPTTVYIKPSDPVATKTETREDAKDETTVVNITNNASPSTVHETDPAPSGGILTGLGNLLR